MNLGIKNKKALVTGASRGIGEAIAQALAKEGVKVAMVARTKSALAKVVEKMEKESKGHVALPADLTASGMPKKVIKNLQKNFGYLDIVVNNIGGALDITDPLCKVTDWRKVWRLNMEVAIEINNLVIPQMKKRGWGRIVNISSIASLENQGTVPYCSIKAALTAYSRSMGRFLAPFGIIMTCVLPGAIFIEGGYWDKTAKERSDHVKKYLSERMAIKRFGKPSEVGEVVAFLCSQQASFCVGSMVAIDGGQGRCFFQ